MFSNKLNILHIPNALWATPHIILLINSETRPLSNSGIVLLKGFYQLNLQKIRTNPLIRKTLSLHSPYDINDEGSRNYKSKGVTPFPARITVCKFPSRFTRRTIPRVAQMKIWGCCLACGNLILVEGEKR